MGKGGCNPACLAGNLSKPRVLLSHAKQTNTCQYCSGPNTCLLEIEPSKPLRITQSSGSMSHCASERHCRCSNVRKNHSCSAWLISYLGGALVSQLASMHCQLISQLHHIAGCRCLLASVQVGAVSKGSVCFQISSMQLFCGWLVEVLYAAGALPLSTSRAVYAVS